MMMMMVVVMMMMMMVVMMMMMMVMMMMTIIIMMMMMMVMVMMVVMMMMTMMMIAIIIYILNCFQRRYSRFCTISSLRREPSPTRTFKWPGRNFMHITCNTSSVYHMQHVVLRATWYEGTAQLLSLTELKSQLYLARWTPLPQAIQMSR